MGTSGGGQGSGGSGGAGGGGGGSRGSGSGRGGSGGHTSSGHGSSSGAAGYGGYAPSGGSSSGSGAHGSSPSSRSPEKTSKASSAPRGSPHKKSGVTHTGRNVAQTVLGNLKPAYLGEQFAGRTLSALVHELTLLKIDLTLNRSWKSMCERLGLPPNASPADVRDKLLRKGADGESDSRIKETATATVYYFFEELCGFNDEVLYGKGSNRTLGEIDHGVIENALETALRIHYINVLQREEPKLLDSKSQAGLEVLAIQMASELVRRLRHKYGSKDQSSEGDFLKRAGSTDEERAWLLTAVRG
jgi:hypothetical protein